MYILIFTYRPYRPSPQDHPDHQRLGLLAPPPPVPARQWLVSPTGPRGLPLLLHSSRSTLMLPMAGTVCVCVYMREYKCIHVFVCVYVCVCVADGWYRVRERV
jgi:hypothetical protein